MSDGSESVRVRAEDLSGALKPCSKSPKQNALVEIRSDGFSGRLICEEAKYGRFESEIAAVGSASFKVQVDGPRLHALVARFPPDGMLELAEENGNLVLHCGRSVATFPGWSETKRAFPTPRGHKGPVNPKPDVRLEAAPKGHTWDFSAQVPFVERDKP